MVGIFVTTYNRATALRRSLAQIAALGHPMLVVDDASSYDVATTNQEICAECGAKYLGLPSNRGLAAAMNIGLSYWMADNSIKWISYFQDDVDVHPKTHEVIGKLHLDGSIFSGHDAGEHQSHEAKTLHGIPVKMKWSIRATHIYAQRDFWQTVYPIPTNELGTPKRKGEGRGRGSDADWWIVRDAPKSCIRTRRPIICVPGLVRSFLWQAKDSSWNNTQLSGEEPPLRTDL